MPVKVAKPWLSQAAIERLIRPPLIETDTGFVSYTSYFRWDARGICDDWRYVLRVANVDTETDAELLPA